MYDAVIVGGRCAGAPLALLLARKGHKVLVVERATFPSDTMSTHFIQAPGMARLLRWGLLEQIAATGCPPVTRACFHQPEGPLEFDLPNRTGLPGLMAPRRYILDKILIDAAVAAGAELAEGVAVDSLIREGERVAGVRGYSSEGTFEARGRFVVGADGRHSTIAELVDAPFLSYTAPLSAGYYSYFSGVEMNATVETALLNDLFCVVFPTNDGLTLAALAWRPERFKELKRDIEGNFRAGLEQLGELGQRVLAGERIERWVGGSDVPNFLREVWGPGWALVGDALFHKDPVPADGITDSFRAADFLADAIDDVLHGGEEAEAMNRYIARHNEYALPQLDAAIRTANLDIEPAKRVEAFFEIRMHNEAETEALLADSVPA